MQMRMRAALSILILASQLASGSAFAQDANENRESVTLSGQQAGEAKRGEIPAQVDSEHWAYRQMAGLMQKYGTEQKLPVGRPCSKGELAHGLLAVLDKVSDTYEKEGAQALRRDDLESIAPLCLALKDELAQLEGYRLRKKTIEEVLVLVEPGEAPFIYKVGMKGFVRGEGASNFNLTEFSQTPGHGEGRFVYRVQPYLYWHPTDYLGFHLEGQGYGFAGGSSDYHEFSLYQGFVEARLPGQDWLALKAGRQEFKYGSDFVQGADSFYDGLSFDAGRLRLKPLDGLTVDLLGGRYASEFSGGVKGSLAGAYASYAPSEKNTFELYGFRDTGSEERHAGERLNTFGLRTVFKIGPATLECEPVYQTGRQFNPETLVNDDIHAYGGHIDLAGEAELAGFKNTIFLSYAVGSGNVNAPNKEFRQPNNESSLVGDMSVLDLSGVDAGESHASGLNIYTVGWGIDLTGELNFSATGRKFVARSVQDGFSRQLGLETDLTLTYNVNKDLSVILGYDRFFTGKFFRDASGSDKDIDYGYAMLVFNLERTKLRPHKM